MIKRVLYLITGDVQGVGYRRFALRKAVEFKVLGWTRNLEDGRVEVMAQGEEEILNNFLTELRQGPPAAKIHNIEIRNFPGPIRYTSFEVWPDGKGTWDE